MEMPDSDFFYQRIRPFSQSLTQLEGDTVLPDYTKASLIEAEETKLKKRSETLRDVFASASRYFDPRSPNFQLFARENGGYQVALLTNGVFFVGLPDATCDRNALRDVMKDPASRMKRGGYEGRMVKEDGSVFIDLGKDIETTAVEGDNWVLHYASYHEPFAYLKRWAFYKISAPDEFSVSIFQESE